MINSETYYTIVYKDLSKEERLALLNNGKFAAAGHSHAFDDLDQLLGTLCYVDRVLVDLSLEGDHRVHSLLATVKNLLKEHGRLPRVESPDSGFQTQPNKQLSYMVGEIECHFAEKEVSILASALELYSEKSETFDVLQRKIEDLYEDHCVKYSLSPALVAYHEMYGTWGTENFIDIARWEGFRDAYYTLNPEVK